jgi:F-type H+-transporting ATPase subunit b
MTLWNVFWLVAAEAAEPKGGLFDINATLPLMAVQFLLFAAILNQVFFKPLTGAIDNRNDYVRNQLAEAKARLSKSQAVSQQYDQELVTSRKAAQDMLVKAQADANKIRNERIAAAIAEGQAKVAAAKAEIAEQKQQATATLEAEVESLSRQVLAKLLGNLVG